MDDVWLAFLAAVVLTSVHIFAERLRLNAIPRSAWLSVAGGTSVAYVFVHLLPELGEAQEAIGEVTGVLPFLERHAYLLALAGLAVFYGVERHSRRSRRQRRETHGEDRTAPAAALLSIGSYVLYNALIGYLLVHRIETATSALILFTLAMGVHFFVNDHGLREHHADLYHRYGRWLVSFAILLGWGVGALTELSEAAIGLLIAFLAGGIVLNVLKEELPDERDSRFSAFAAGAAGYALLLLSI